METFKSIDNYEGLYEVSNHGRIKSLQKGGRIMNQTLCRNYMYVGLSNNKHKAFKRVHRLVALAFIPNPNSLPEVNHKDGNKLNNVSNNLEWNTSSQNQSHAYKTGLQKKKLSQTDIKNIKELRLTMTLREIAERYGVSIRTIHYHTT